MVLRNSVSEMHLAHLVEYVAARSGGTRSGRNIIGMPARANDGNAKLVRVSQICASLVILIGVLKWMEHLGGWKLGLDLLGFYDARAVASPTRLGMAGALNRLLLGSALLLATSRRYFRTFQFLTLTSLLIGWLGLSRYFFGSATLSAFESLTVHGASCFVLLGAGLLCTRTDGGLMALLVSNSSGGLIARRLLLPMLLGPLLMNWVESRFTASGWVDAESASWLFILSDTLIFGALVWFNAVILHRVDVRRELAETVRRQMASIVESSEDAIISKDLNGIVTSWNRGAEKIFGYTASEMVGFSIMRLIPPERADEETHILEKIRSGKSVEHFETERQTKSGARIDVSVTASPLKDAEGNVIGASKVARDVTDRKKGEAALRLFRTLVDQSNDTFEVIDAQTGRFLDVNDKGCVELGYTRTEFLRLRLSDVDPSITAVNWPQKIDALRAAGSISGEGLHRRKDGTTFPVEYSAKWVPLDRNYIVMAVRDISMRKQHEAELLDAQVRLSSALAAGAIGTWSWDIVHDNLIADSFTARMFSLDAKMAEKGLPAQAYLQAIHENDQPGVGAALKRAIDTCGTYDIEYRVWQKDGTFRWLQARGRVAGNAAGEALNFYGAVQEISERKLAEFAISEKEAQFRRLFEAAKDGILILNAFSGKITDCNPYLMNLLGYTLDEVLGKELWEIGVFEKIVASKAAFIELQIKEYIRFENMPLKTKDGRQIAVEFVSNSYAVGNKKVIQCNIRDISERVKLEAQLRQAQKMEVVGQLAGGVAHDFNNLLTVINGRSQIAMDRFEPEDKTRRDLELIFKTGERAAGLTRQLLAFSRQQVLQPVVLDLNTVVMDMDMMLRRMVREDIDISTKLDPKLMRVKVDPGQIEQVIVNLMVNARDAMPDGGKVTLETANVELSEEFCATRPELKPGPHVLLAVSDTGHGMDSVVKTRIFEPFYTTKPRGQGTGLGLAMVFGVVKQSNGHIQVYSEVGKGTTFKIYLPRTEEELARSSTSVDPRITFGHGVILVVEDEEYVRDLMRDILSNSGYTVLAAGNGDEALKLFSENKGVDLLLSDVVMPGMSGPELAVRIKAQAPDIKVLFASGYTDHAIVRHGTLDAGLAFIQKPFTSASLTRKIREVMEQKKE